MKEPSRLSMSTGLQHQEKIKKIPLPAIIQESERPQAGNGFWKFIAEHEASREQWKKNQKSEDKTSEESN